MPDHDETVPGDVTRLPSASPASTTGWLSSSDAISHGRFAPGTILSDRYRIIGLLGKGGMGEVYRADDLKLGQSVALKFLPETLAHDPVRLAQFHGEVRLARQISHPNVCRVYDVGEVDGQTFLSMEYVDGEDLSSLLRRIGRLPEDKALEIARQFCAGVAAAHDRGVLHRDLKPANVMIDGRGSVRIMDFGLAVVGGAAAEIRAGTPAYMAPEQLAGKEVTVRSDVYAIGLVLFELFTGRRAFAAATLAELLRLHETDAIPRPTDIVSGLEPTIERAILRCLERDPIRRPPSALAVAAALPGGDPIAAALAAGETPSPAMVAAAGQEQALSARIAIGSIAAIAVILATLPFIANRTVLLNLVPPPRSVDVLVERAQTLRATFGYPETPRDEVHGVAYDSAYLGHIRDTDRSPTRWQRLRSGRPAALRFWYRSSPRELARIGISREPTLSDPPFILSGMTIVMTDVQGRLVEFAAIPPQVETSSEPAPPPDWRALFAAAELPMERFTPTASTWTPRMYADTRMAWEGTLPEDPSIRVRIEAAAYRGRPVYFAMIAPWTRPARMEVPQQSTTDRVLAFAGVAILITTLAGAGIMARRHLKRGRGDRRGADRLAFFIVGLLMAAWLIGNHHSSDLNVEFESVLTHLAQALLLAAINWVFYLALEPLVRKWQPQTLVGWTRLLSGAIRDPQVGRDFLAGIAAGCLFALVRAPRALTAPLIGEPPGTPYMPAFVPALGADGVIVSLIALVQNAIAQGMMLILAYALLRMLLRRSWLAFGVIGTVVGAIVTLQLLRTPGAWTQLILVALGMLTVLVVIMRFGLLATIVMIYVGIVLEVFPLTTDPSARHFPAAMWILSGVLAFACFAVYAARAGQPLFRLADD